MFSLWKQTQRLDFVFRANFKNCIEQRDTGSSKAMKYIQEIYVSESVEAIETCPH
jgi:hypothetical protein